VLSALLAHWALAASLLGGAGGLGALAFMFPGPALVAWKWLSHASLWQLICIALIVLIIVQRFQLADARHDRDAYAKQRDGYRAKLEAISTAKNEQKAETAERIKVVTRTIHDADGKAKVIEGAKLPGNCISPREVLDADI
jgi:hypothetical protein